MKKNKLFTNILAMALVMIAMIVVVITVGLFRTSPEETLEGQAETTDYRLSSKVPARVLEIRVKEGDFVHRGDTLVVEVRDDGVGGAAVQPGGGLVDEGLRRLGLGEQRDDVRLRAVH